MTLAAMPGALALVATGRALVTTLAAAGLVVGIPAGLLAGELLWRRVADGLGVATASAIPAVAVLLTIPCAIALVNLVAFVPARAAARARPAIALRSE